MNYEKERKEKSTVDKILPWITLILSITTLIQVSISIFQYLRDVNPTFWEKFFFWFNVIPWSIIGISLIIGGIWFFIMWLKHKDKWKNRKKIAKEFDQKIKDEIKYDDIIKIAEEIIVDLPILLDAKIEGMNSFYWHIGLQIAIANPITEDGRFELSDTDEEYYTNLYLCKFSVKDKKTLEILGSTHITEWIAKDIQMHSAEIFMWEKLFEKLTVAGWEKIILCSSWKEKKYIRKYCLKKDDNLLIYSIEKTNTKCKI